MIIPIGHEQDTVRRLPWITFGIMGICVLALCMSYAFQGDSGEVYEAYEEALEYFWERPYLELPEDFAEYVFDGASEEERAGMIAMIRSQAKTPTDPEVVISQQQTLDRLCEKAMEGDESDPWRRFGLIPAKQSAMTWITHLFMHGDFIHLLGNLLILYLAGPFVEDVWGRWLYSAFYLVAGLFASLVFVLREPDLTIPLIGASGAIAGVMGAFLVRYSTTKIRFFYIFGLIFRGTFDAPAWLMLPMWFFEQLIMARMTDQIGGSGVAYWAHVGGFVFGVGAALAIKYFRIEEEYINPAIAQKTTCTVVSNPVVEQALEAQQAGNDKAAFDLLNSEIRRNPGNRDAALALWTMGDEQGMATLAAPALVALIRSEVRAGETDLAVEHWRELLAKAPSCKLDANLIVRISQILNDRGETGEAAKALRMALLRCGSTLPVPVALKIADNAREIDPRISRGAIELALANPDMVPMERARAMEILQSIGA